MCRLILTSFLFLALTVQAQVGPVKTEIRTDNGKHQLYRNGEPYFVRGAGGFSYFNRLKEYGGNSVRMWTTEGADSVLDNAHKLGLTVTLGLWMVPTHYGMDYHNEAKVAEQKERIRQDVLKYKDHPALLMWGIGNEIGLISFDVKMYKAIQDIAKMIHEIDPNHPTTTMLAGAPVKHLKIIKKHCPDIDLVSINAFREVPYIYIKIDEARWKKPYLISEWGCTGYWEATTTSWGAFIEETSTEKAEICRKRYEAISQQKNCIGSYLFLWGQKQERTETLFTLIHKSGHETETVELMQQLWKNEPRKNLAPRVIECKIDGKVAKQNIKLKTGREYKANVKIKEPENEQVVYYWEILHETSDLKNGEGERKPEWLPDRIKNPNSSEITFKAPDKPGAYRLFMYAYDNHNYVATANVPFYVEK